MYTVRVVGDGTSVGQGCTVCTTSPCFYVQQVSAIATNITISVTSINGDGILGSQYSTTTYGERLKVKIIIEITRCIDVVCACILNDLKLLYTKTGRSPVQIRLLHHHSINWHTEPVSIKGSGTEGSFCMQQCLNLVL